MSVAGALRFGRYAFPPNRLGYCGPDESDALLQYVTAGAHDAGLAELERRFEAAFPYLQLIAESSGIDDPFDARVVRAYWVGGPLLGRVRPRGLDATLARYRPRLRARDFDWLRTTVGAGARPHHNFHVFDVYRRAGALRGDAAAPALAVMDGCRVSWGRVIESRPGALTVLRAPLVIRGGRLALGDETPCALASYGDDLGPGDVVAAHWSWACERLAPRDLAVLRAETDRALALANLTL